MLVKYLFRPIGRIFHNLYLLTFLIGFLWASLLYFKMEGDYEKELFSSIQKNINKKIDANDTQDSVVIKIMQTCNNLLVNRATVFSGDGDVDGFKASCLHPATLDLMTTKGACGSYSLVLARILQNYHFPVRIAQMKAGGVYGAHNITEVKIHSGWVVLDPTYDLYFTKPDGQLAGFTEIQQNWAFYSRQLPKGYNPVYKYEGVRYTNWGKIPVVSPLIKGMLDLYPGTEKSGTICMRVLFLRVYDLYFFITLLALIFSLIITLKKMIQTKIFPRYDIPFTFSNIIKYIKLRIENLSLKESLNT